MYTIFLWVGHIQYESPFGCLVAFGSHPKRIDVNLHPFWVALPRPIPWLGTLPPPMDFWLPTAYWPWCYSTSPCFGQILCETFLSGHGTQTQHTRGWGVPGVASPKFQPSVGLPPGRPPPKGEVAMGVASGFPTSLGPPYKHNARLVSSPAGDGYSSLKPPHPSHTLQTDTYQHYWRSQHQYKNWKQCQSEQC